MGQRRKMIAFDRSSVSQQLESLAQSAEESQVELLLVVFPHFKFSKTGDF